LPERPKKKRRLDSWELRKDSTQLRHGGTRKRCRICRQIGHRRNGYPQAPKESQLSHQLIQKLSHQHKLIKPRHQLIAVNKLKHQQMVLVHKHQFTPQLRQQLRVLKHKHQFTPQLRQQLIHQFSPQQKLLLDHMHQVDHNNQFSNQVQQPIQQRKLLSLMYNTHNKLNQVLHNKVKNHQDHLHVQMVDQN